MSDVPLTSTPDVEPPAGLPDISVMDFWTGDRAARRTAFRQLRDTPGLPFYPERMLADSPIPPGPGYYALTRHDDIWHASRNAQLFCSSRGGVNIGDLNTELSEFFGSMISMDDPKHFRLRSIVSKGFTPKHIGALEGQIQRAATNLVDRMIAEHPDRRADFVEAFAGPFPLAIICSMMGIPETDTKQIFDWTNTILGVGDPEYGGTYEALLQTALEIFAYAQALGEDRRANPTDDITSALMHAELDGDRLTAQEFGSFFILLVVAGNETTRNAITHGLKALTDHPEQRDLWFADFDTHARTAVEEIVRWATPVIHFRRTVTADTELSGVQLHEGDKIVMFYESANRDERVYERPDEFDVTRAVNPTQVGFGAGGPHFCLGANLARREITVAFDEIRRRLPDLRATGEPDYLQSNFINGIKRLPCAW
ncbi:MAG: cytochrome P450 [Ilumatobacter sp.]|uniref:cytochrome P450 n=1 Tax=Ilumatobacter sp. TaxID=1967498 RepID=UPI00261D5286|nr:cytochrome P450 [Ilumatobacter sp.]MDJ0769217.1 cytochrome P450 [Ilumatobacter sp.]